MERAEDAAFLDYVEDMVRQFRENEHTELEVRLVDFQSGVAQPGVTRQYYEDLVRAQLKGDNAMSKFTKVVPAHFYRTYYFDDFIRVTQDVPQGPLYHRVVPMVKLDLNCPERPYGLRIALKSEVPLTAAECFTVKPAQRVRCIERESLVRHHTFRYDYSQSSCASSLEECRKAPRVIHVELEMLRNEEFLSKHSNHWIARTLVGLSRDLLGRYEQGKPVVPRLVLVEYKQENL